jgi:hypothetical protein
MNEVAGLIGRHMTNRVIGRCWVRVCLLLITLAVGSLWADLSGPVGVDLLVNQADTIVTGMVLQGRQSMGVAALTVQVDHVMKGTVRFGDVLTISWQSPRQGSAPDINFQAVRGLFFVNNTASNHWILVSATVNPLDVRGTFFRLPPGTNAAQVSYGTADSVLDKVIRELLPTENYRLSMPGGTAVLDTVSTAVHAAANSTALRDVARALVLSSKQEERITGLHALLVLGDGPALASVETGQDQLLTSGPGIALLETIRQYYRNSDSTSVAALGRMSQAASNPGLKSAVSAALAWMHTRETLPYLAQLLDSQDAAILQYAVGGLAMFANNVPLGKYEPAPGPAPYRTVETIAHSAMSAKLISTKQLYYVGFWKQCWSEHQTELSH